MNINKQVSICITGRVKFKKTCFLSSPDNVSDDKALSLHPQSKGRMTLANIFAYEPCFCVWLVFSFLHDESTMH